MAKYLIKARYTSEGVKGVIANGGSARRDAVARALEDAGGSLESFYFGFGGVDAYVVADLPDNVTAAALGMNVGASGGATTETVVLLTPEEIDAAAGMSSSYVPPGA